MSRPLTIIVGGYIIGFPLGGMTWHHLNYLLGLHELGHEVWFLEDSSNYAQPYNPVTGTCEADSAYGRGYLESAFAEYGLPVRYCYYSEFEDRHYGLSKSELHGLLARADLLLCVSGVTPLRPERPRPRRLAVIDTDPVFTQLRLGWDADFMAYYRAFDAVATFGRLIGSGSGPLAPVLRGEGGGEGSTDKMRHWPSSTSDPSPQPSPLSTGARGPELPTHGLHWIPTNQPIALQHWPMTPCLSRTFTTIGRWEHDGERNVEFEGVRYRSSKGPEWMKMLDLPRRVPWEMQMGMQKMPGDVRGKFAEQGWKIIDPQAATMSCRGYGDFIRGAAGEFTVAKEIYTGLPSGWFSDRAAAFLASGRPVVTQGSGFERWLPIGEGLFAVATVEEAAGALNAIALDYSRHAAAARRIAEDYFDARKVLAVLLESVM